MKYQDPLGPPIDIRFFVHQEQITHSQLFLTSRAAGVQWEVFSANKNVVQAIHSWVTSYCQKKQVIECLPLAMDNLSSFTRSVLLTLSGISPGETLSYQQVAQKLEKPQSARAVGQACGRNPFPLIIPCHRVISQGNRLGGFSLDLEIKRILLEFEGVSV